MNSVRYSDSYFQRQYQRRFWRRRGQKLVLHRTWIRVLRATSGSNGKWLEVGSGEGEFLRCAQKFLPSVIGCDLSFDGVKNAKREGCCRVLQASADRLPFADSHFDVVIALDLIEHLEAPRAFMREAARVLRPGGLLAFSTPNPESFGARKKGANWFAKHDPTHVSILNRSEWKDLIQECGFAVVRDGTDTAWDIPYWHGVPVVFQWIALIGLKHFLHLFDVMFPWRFGENYVCIARINLANPRQTDAMSSPALTAKDSLC